MSATTRNAFKCNLHSHATSKLRTLSTDSLSLHKEDDRKALLAYRDALLSGKCTTKDKAVILGLRWLIFHLLHMDLGSDCLVLYLF